jgi:UDP-glucose 4-epimerase
VVVIDNESTGNIDNIKHLSEGNIDLDLGDITDMDLVSTFEDCDYVFHQAALPSVPRSIKDPLSSNEVNVSGTLKVLIAANEASCKKVVSASSSSVYGDTPVLPKVETMEMNPKSPYAVTKATGEMYSKVFEEVYGLQTASLRYFNVFGPRQDPNSQYSAVIPKFIAKLLKGDAPVIYGDGEQSRDFTFVKKVVQANILAAESNKTGAFNVACGKRYTLNELVGMLNEILGTDIGPEYAEERAGDIKHSLADVSRVGSIGYSGAGEFIDELRVTADFFRD